MLEVINISKKFGKHVALSNLSFKLDRGEILAIVGENGAGKSTALKIIAGLLKPDSGRVLYFGKELSKSVKNDLGFLPENDALYDEMLASEYLNFFAEIFRVNIDVEEHLRIFGLPNKTIGEYSKGMKRLLSIARALLHNPKIIICDEPTSSLDPLVSFKVMSILKERAKQGNLVVFSTHNLHHAEFLADYVLILKSGKTVYYGSLPAVHDSLYIVRYVYNGEEHSIEVRIQDVAKCIEEVLDAGGRIVEIRKATPKLEELYFSLTGF